MKKIEVSLESVRDSIKEFYRPTVYHFLTLNGVALDETKTEIQWIFSKYGEVDSSMMFYTIVNQDDVIPSIADIIPSAIISQREIVDMFGIEIEGSEKGLYLDEDSLQKPLSGGCVI